MIVTCLRWWPALAEYFSQLWVYMRAMPCTPSRTFLGLRQLGLERADFGFKTAQHGLLTYEDRFLFGTRAA